MNPWSKIFPALTHFSAVLCEKVLSEIDQVTSAIRIVDVFHVTPFTDRPTVIEMKVLVLGRFSDLALKSSYALGFEIRGPNGKGAKGHPVHVSTARRFDDVPGGFATEAVINVALSKPGTHYVVVSIDEVEVAHVPFTVRVAAATSEE